MGSVRGKRECPGSGRKRDVDHALAAYNAGPQAVKQRGINATREAAEYVAAIRSFYRG